MSSKFGEIRQWTTELAALELLKSQTYYRENDAMIRLAKRFKRRCLKIMVIYMYMAPGQGQTTQTTPWGQMFSLTVLFSQSSPLLQDFLHKMTL